MRQRPTNRDSALGVFPTMFVLLAAGEKCDSKERFLSGIGCSRVPHERVVQWLRTWGTAGFRRWPDQ